MKILVINCGSSSLKFQLIDSESQDILAKGLCERIGIEGSRLLYIRKDCEKQIKATPMTDHTQAMKLVLSTLTGEGAGVIKSLSEIDAVGHRIVHGGEKFRAATRITPEVIKAIEECSELAPLHNPANLTGIRSCMELMPDTPMAAVFDTAFHQTMPQEAWLYGLPYSYYEKYRIRRYGFHGTSHSYVSHRAAEVLGKPFESLKLIVCHLGNGASVSAVRYGKCVDTSMGLTPLEGLVMGTRSGDLDPAVLPFLARKSGKGLDEIMDILNRESGVLGLSGGFSSDFRDLEEAYRKQDTAAVRAVEVFIYRVVKYIGAYVAAMNGVDAVCFTAGVGENSPFIREKIGKRLTFLGITLDPQANEKRGEDTVITTSDSPVKVLVIPTNEELAIAGETCAVCAQDT